MEKFADLHESVLLDRRAEKISPAGSTRERSDQVPPNCRLKMNALAKHDVSTDLSKKMRTKAFIQFDSWRNYILM